jgi:hypothetical protein
MSSLECRVATPGKFEPIWSDKRRMHSKTRQLRALRFSHRVFECDQKKQWSKSKERSGSRWIQGSCDGIREHMHEFREH